MQPQVDVEQNTKKVPLPQIVWEGKESASIYYRLVVKHFTTGNAPKAILEKCATFDHMNMPIWLEHKDGIPTCILNALAKLASEDETILDPKVIK